MQYRCDAYIPRTDSWIEWDNNTQPKGSVKAYRRALLREYPILLTRKYRIVTLDIPVPLVLKAGIRAFGEIALDTSVTPL